MVKSKSTQAELVERQKLKIDAFKRLATKRVNKALKVLASVGDLSNKTSYAYDDAQVSKISAALTAGIAAIAKRFDAAKTGTGSQGFEL